MNLPAGILKEWVELTLGGHWLWCGPVRNGEPVMSHQTQKRVRLAVWEANGKEALPSCHRLVAGCVEPLCVKPGHQKVVSFRERTRALEPRAFRPNSRTLEQVKAVAEAYQTGQYTYAELGEAMSLPRQAVARMVRRYEEHLLAEGEG